MLCQTTPLAQESLLHIQGPDSLTFLQGQTTCDTRTLDPDHAVPGAYCTPQGRVVCDFLLSQLEEDHYALRMRRDIVASSSAIFGKYIIFSKAQLDAGRDDWQVQACWGPDARQILHDIFGSAPGERFAASHGTGFVLVQVDHDGQQFECYHNNSCTAQLQQLAATAALATESQWQALQLHSGIGRVEAATVEAFIPQMLNYDLTGHINFNKGCYTGQEVVARLHYRGKSKRRMHLAELATEHPALAGTALYSSSSEQSVGNIVNSAADAEGRVMALAVTTQTGLDNGLHLGAVDGPTLSPRELPYSLDADQALTDRR
ncbi:MAG: hypothetical protein V7700_03390 [Halioglobus sp.]